MSTDLVQPPFTAVANKIGRLLASANVDPLAVPRFQREFAWTTDEVEKLLRDLARAQRTTPLSPDYFLGSIVMSAGKPLEIIEFQSLMARRCPSRHRREPGLEPGIAANGVDELKSRACARRQYQELTGRY